MGCLWLLTFFVLCPVAKHAQHRRGVSSAGLAEPERLTRVVVDDLTEGPNPEKPLRRARRARALEEVGRLPGPPPIPESARGGGGGGELEEEDGGEEEGGSPPSLPGSSARGGRR